MAKPVKRRVKGSRVTPKAGAGPTTGPASGKGAPTPTGRYTPPIPREMKVSPPWVPVLMFVLLGLGVIVIIGNYVSVLPGWGFLPDDTSNMWLLVGLGFILGGILTATQYH
jgi:hypothetical protein